MADDEISPEEQELFEDMQYGGYPKPEEKNNIFTFFKRIISQLDTTRVANLNEVELGQVKVPVRTLQNLSLYCHEVGLSGLGDYFAKESQIITSTSLGKEGFIPKLAVTSKREMEARTKVFSDKQKKTWFKRKEKQVGEF